MGILPKWSLDMKYKQSWKGEPSDSWRYSSSHDSKLMASNSKRGIWSNSNQIKTEAEHHNELKVWNAQCCNEVVGIVWRRRSLLLLVLFGGELNFGMWMRLWWMDDSASQSARMNRESRRIKWAISVALFSFIRRIHQRPLKATAYQNHPSHIEENVLGCSQLANNNWVDS